MWICVGSILWCNMYNVPFIFAICITIAICFTFVRSTKGIYMNLNLFNVHNIIFFCRVLCWLLVQIDWIILITKNGMARVKERKQIVWSELNVIELIAKYWKAFRFSMILLFTVIWINMRFLSHPVNPIVLK